MRNYEGIRPMCMAIAVVFGFGLLFSEYMDVGHQFWCAYVFILFSLIATHTSLDT